MEHKEDAGLSEWDVDDFSMRLGGESCGLKLDQRPGVVFVGQTDNGKWPFDLEDGVVVVVASGRCWMKRFAHLVKDFCVICQSLKPMGESFANCELPAVVSGEFECDPLTVSW